MGPPWARIWSPLRPGAFSCRACHLCEAEGGFHTGGHPRYCRICSLRRLNNYYNSPSRWWGHWLPYVFHNKDVGVANAFRFLITLWSIWITSTRKCTVVSFICSYILKRWDNFSGIIEKEAEVPLIPGSIVQMTPDWSLSLFQEVTLRVLRMQLNKARFRLHPVDTNSLGEPGAVGMRIPADCFHPCFLY